MAAPIIGFLCYFVPISNAAMMLFVICLSPPNWLGLEGMTLISSSVSLTVALVNIC